MFTYCLSDIADEPIYFMLEGKENSKTSWQIEADADLV
jgi:hypothetical protein